MGTKFKTMKTPTITLTEDAILDLMYGKSHKVKGWEGWSIEADEDTGEFDGEKGSMCDYEITLFDPEGNPKWSAIDGYYTGISGHNFSNDVEFWPYEEP